MPETAGSSKGSFAAALGGLVGLIAGELGAAAAVAGGVGTGFAAFTRAQAEWEASWPLYLVAGGIFVAVLVACRWRGPGRGGRS